MTTTSNYITNILPTKPFFKYDRILFEKAIIFIHKHPLVLKITQIAVFIFDGFLFLNTLPLFATNSFLAIIYLISSLTLSVISYLAIKIFKIIAPPIHNMKNHAFEPLETKDATLYYKGDVPIFHIKTNDPYKIGFSHGYILAKHINRIRSLWSFAFQKLPEFLYFHTSPKAQKIPKIIEKIKENIPKDYLIEMQGLVDGFNKWANEKIFLFRPKKLTLNELILFHLEADTTHFKHLKVEKNLLHPIKQKAVACTAIVAKDKDNSNVFASTTDWPTIGFGDLSIVFIKENQNGSKRAEIGLPGFIGTLAGMNSYGLALRMNVCSGDTKSVEGIPNPFLTRLCLEKSKDPSDVQRVIENNPSLGPFHITACTEKTAKIFFIRQGQNIPYRTKESTKYNSLIVTNYRYDTDAKENPSEDILFSSQREKRLYSFFKDIKKHIFQKNIQIKPLLKAALRLPFVNNLISSHSIIMDPKNRSIEVSFDNAYSSKNTFHLLENIL